MGKMLIAVVTCHARRNQAVAQRFTWARDQENVRFFLGGGEPEHSKEVILPVDDSYTGLPAKVKAVMGWARENGYDSVLKIDDDVYLVIDRILRAGFFHHDYVGNFRARNGSYPHDYASGFAYYLSGRAVGIIADADLTEDTMEDRWVGSVLSNPLLRISAYDEKRFACTYPCGVDSAKYLWGSPIGKSHLAFAQYPAKEFAALDYWYRRIHAVQYA